MYTTGIKDHGLISTLASLGTMFLIGIFIMFILGAWTIPLFADSGKDKIFQIPFVTLDKGFRSGIRDRLFVVIKAEKEWGDLWRLHKGTFLPNQPVPNVDFDQEMVVAVFSGEKRTGGYGIEVKKAEKNFEKSQLDVYFLETRPSPNSMVIQALTQPYHMVKLKKVGIPLMFIPIS